MNEYDIILNQNNNENDITTIIQQQIVQLQDLKNKVETSIQKAEKAQSLANDAKEQSASLFHKKSAIEHLQDATVALAEGLNAEVDAQEISFEYQQKLGEFTKFLLTLGLSDRAHNRTIVREITMRLKGASQEELDELAKQELLNVVKELKAQEDIMKKQSNLSEKVKVHEKSLRQHKQTSEQHDKMIASNRKLVLEHDKQLNEKTQKDKNQDAEMARQAAKDDELEKKISKGEEKDKLQDAEMARQAAKDEEMSQLINQLIASGIEKDAKIKDLQEKCDELLTGVKDNTRNIESKESGLYEKLNEKATKKSVIISYIIGAAGLIAALLQFFI